MIQKVKQLREKNENNLENINNAIKETAKEKLGHHDKSKKIVIDTSVEKMLKEQQQIRIKIENCSDPNKITELKYKRKKILKELTKKVKEVKNKELEEILIEVGEVKDDAKMFKAAKKLKQKQYENPFVHNKDGKSVTNKQEMYNIIEEHFKNHFQKNNIEEFEKHQGQPKPLNNRINKKKQYKKLLVRCQTKKHQVKTTSRQN